MKGKKLKAAIVASKNGVALQDRIRDRWGRRCIQRAKKRLCSNCEYRNGCLLLPLCSDGMDCPYFRKINTRLYKEVK